MKPTIKVLWFVIGILATICLNSPGHAQTNKLHSLEQEVFYHIFLRSFYDSDGDGHGDLNGVRAKLDYLQQLGATAVLISPLYHSKFYHNYFPIDFEAIDPEFGTKEDYFALLRELHHRGMKLIMDMEIHYVTEDHLWYRDSYQNPASAYSQYILYQGPDNTEPVSIIFNLTELPTYDGQVIKVCTTNLYSQAVRDYHHRLFKYWVDPNADGDFEDGIDGFRIDHIMDDLDYKGKLTGLLANFWKPLFDALRAIRPDIIIIGEQAEWGYGEDYFRKAEVNGVFAFPLGYAIRKLEAKEIQKQWLKTDHATPENRYQFLFIENHDMPRIASVLNGGWDQLKIAAALNLLLKGVPIIYYGQELGMKGANGLGKFGATDGNDIPAREAFEWYRTVEGPGMALWYKNTGPWWDQSELKANDGISLEEQQFNPNSLWTFYRKLIALRRSLRAFQTGRIEFLDDNNDQVLSFLRWNEEQAILVVMNLKDKEASLSLDISRMPVVPNQVEIVELLQPGAGRSLDMGKGKMSIKLTNFEVQVWRIR